MPHRSLPILTICAALALLGACAPAAAPPTPPAPDLALGSPLWDTPATRQSLALGGLALEHPFPGEGLCAVFTGQDPGALVSRPLELRPGARYRLRLSLRRQDFVNDHYLWLNLWGAEQRLDAHCVVGGWQELLIEGRAPAGGRGVVAIRNHSASRLMVRSLSLEELPEPAVPAPMAAWPGGPFPWGVYVAAGHLEQAAALGFNTVITGTKPSQLRGLLSRAKGLKLRVILFASPSPASLAGLIKELDALPVDLRPLALYVVDEPEIRSYSLERLMTARQTLNSRLPWVRLVTAMVRPESVARYGGVYDAVFMDQYPVPGQPLNWQADSILRARQLVRPGGQVWAVLQGFGGGRFTAMGWPRLPNPREAQALGAASLASGAQGMVVFHWRYFSHDPALSRAFNLLARRLQTLGPWLPLTPGLPPGMSLTHLGRVQADPGGGPAVRTGWAGSPQGRLILAVNTTAYKVEAGLSGVGGAARDLWSGESLPAVGGQMRWTLEPLAARAWLLPAP